MQKNDEQTCIPDPTKRLERSQGSTQLIILRRLFLFLLPPLLLPNCFPLQLLPQLLRHIKSAIRPLPANCAIGRLLVPSDRASLAKVMLALGDNGTLIIALANDALERDIFQFFLLLVLSSTIILSLIFSFTGLLVNLPLAIQFPTLCVVLACV